MEAEAATEQHSIGNKMIADFDDRLEYIPPTWIYQEGYRVRDGYSLASLSPFTGEKKAFIVDALSYHESWDWLMPVVAKINKECNEEVESDMWRFVADIQRAVSYVDIETAWKNVVEYLEDKNKK